MLEIEDKCPEISEELIKYLKKFFPDVLPECKMNEYIRESVFMRLIGHQDVISHLESELKSQLEAREETNV